MTDFRLITQWALRACASFYTMGRAGQSLARRHFSTPRKSMLVFSVTLAQESRHLKSERPLASPSFHDPRYTARASEILDVINGL